MIRLREQGAVDEVRAAYEWTAGIDPSWIEPSGRVRRRLRRGRPAESAARVCPSTSAATADQQKGDHRRGLCGRHNRSGATAM